MSGRGLPESFEKACRLAGVPVSRANGVAQVTAGLFDDLGHVHGMTRSVRPLLPWLCALDAARADAIPEAQSRHAHGVILKHAPLSASDAAILRRAVLLSRQEGVPSSAGLSGRGARRQAARLIALRQAALLRIARALADAGASRRDDVSALDHGSGVALFVRARVRGPAAVRSVRAACDLWNAILPKPIRSVSACRGPMPDAGLVGPDDSPRSAARRILGRLWEQYASREYGLGYPEDPEFVHEMRVATRRMRSALRLFRGVVAVTEGVRTGLSDLADALGAVRDADVFIAFLARGAQRAKGDRRELLEQVLDIERVHRQRHDARLLRFEASPACRRLRAQWAAASGAARSRSRGGAGPFASEAMARLLRKLGAADPPLRRRSAAELHSLRIACKRLRYAAEFFAGLCPDRLTELGGTAVRMQSLLGDVHDADVFAERLAAEGRRRPSLTRGRFRRPWRQLLARLKRRRAEALAEADRTWRSFRRRKRWRRTVESVRNVLGSEPGV